MATKGVRFGGRQKGTPNRISAEAKAALLEAFHLVGGVEYLVQVAREDPRTFCGLLARILPQEPREVPVDSTETKVVIVVPAKLPQEQWTEMVQSDLAAKAKPEHQVAVWKSWSGVPEAKKT